MSRVLLTILSVLVSTNVFAFPAEPVGYEEEIISYPSNMDAGIILGYIKKESAEEFKDTCARSFDKINEIALRSEKDLLGTESTALRTRLAYASNRREGIKKCRAEVYSFNSAIAINYKQTDLKKHLGSKSNRKAACLEELNTLKSNPHVLFTEYADRVDAFMGHICNVRYIIIEENK